MNRMKFALIAAALASVCTLSCAASAKSWFEGAPGAGDTLATAQLVPYSPPAAGSFSVDSIFGSMEISIPINLNYSIVHTDVFKIFVSDPTTFLATTSNSGTLDDTSLFLFDSNGYGVFMNDDDGIGLFGQSTLPLGTLTGKSAGFYYLAVGLTQTMPFGADGAIFDGSGHPYEPAANALTGFKASELSQSQAALPYEIDLKGVSGTISAAVPEPGSYALLLGGLAALVLGRRLRKSATGV